VFFFFFLYPKIEDITLLYANRYALQAKLAHPNYH